MGKVIHWREDAKDMSFDDFKEFHKDLFVDCDEMKQAYKDATGKDPEEKKQSRKKQASNEGEAE